MDANDDDDADHQGRRGIPPGVKAKLKAWLLSPEHIMNPYPTPAEQTLLLQETGIEIKQLRMWFTNARRRIWKPLIATSIAAATTGMMPATTAMTMTVTAMKKITVSLTASATATTTTTTNEVNELWDVVRVIPQDGEKVECRGCCTDQAIATWSSNVDPEDKWNLCETCQLEEFGGLPDDDSRVNNDDDSSDGDRKEDVELEEVKQIVNSIVEREEILLTGQQNDDLFHTILKESQRKREELAESAKERKRKREDSAIEKEQKKARQTEAEIAKERKVVENLLTSMVKEVEKRSKTSSLKVDEIKWTRTHPRKIEIVEEAGRTTAKVSPSLMSRSTTTPSSCPSVEFRIMWTDKDDDHLLKCKQIGESWDEMALSPSFSSCFTSEQIRKRYYNSNRTGLKEYREAAVAAAATKKKIGKKKITAAATKKKQAIREKVAHPLVEDFYSGVTMTKTSYAAVKEEEINTPKRVTSQTRVRQGEVSKPNRWDPSLQFQNRLQTILSEDKDTATIIEGHNELFLVYVIEFTEFTGKLSSSITSLISNIEQKNKLNVYDGKGEVAVVGYTPDLMDLCWARNVTSFKKIPFEIFGEKRSYGLTTREKMHHKYFPDSIGCVTPMGTMKGSYLKKIDERLYNCIVKFIEDVGFELSEAVLLNSSFNPIMYNNSTWIKGGAGKGSHHDAPGGGTIVASWGASAPLKIHAMHQDLAQHLPLPIIADSLGEAVFKKKGEMNVVYLSRRANFFRKHEVLPLLKSGTAFSVAIFLPSSAPSDTSMVQMANKAGMSPC